MLSALRPISSRRGGCHSGWPLRLVLKNGLSPGMVGSELIESDLDGSVALLELRITNAERGQQIHHLA